jgi:hypothetical protein
MSSFDTVRCDVPFVLPVGMVWQTKDFPDHVGTRDYHIASDGTVWMLLDTNQNWEVVRLPTFSGDVYFSARVDGTEWTYWLVVERGRVARVVQLSPQHGDEEDD